MKLQSYHYELMNKLEQKYEKLVNVPEDDPMLQVLRKSLGVKQDPENWVEDNEELLRNTSYSANDVAIQIGIPKHKILKARQKLGVKIEQTSSWTEENIKLLEDTSLTHREVAKRVGVDESTVWTQRKRRGIKYKDKRLIDWTPEKLEILKRTDLTKKDKSKILNISISAINRKLKEDR